MNRVDHKRTLRPAMHQTLTNPEAAAPARLRRLLVVMPSYYPDTYGGAERQAKLLSGALAEKGVEITLIHPILQDGLPEREDAPFGEIRRIRTRSFPANGGRQIGSFIAWTRKLSAWIRAHGAGFDAIYVFHARLHVLGALLGAAAVGKPIFVKIGGGGLGSDFAALRAKRYLYGRWVQTRAVSQVDAFIAPSRQVEEDLAALGVGPERIWAIPNGVVALTGEALEAAFTQRAGKRFICVGRVETLKRADLAVEAAGELAKRTRDFELLFLGDGPLLAPLQARVAELGLADQVRFLGRVGDVYPHLLAADYFLMPSLREGQSNALLEGLSAGLPALCGAASGVSDIVQDGVNGFVVDSDAPAAWAEAMARLIDLPAHARIGLGRAAHARTQPISIDATAQLTLDLINERLAARER